ncbi:hypothetical protein [Bryobacter aggregatus]|uniref:hypothetical protein n=1 Tax=Bryobacter aggregatus TaxID=360054 RepID=UPI0004E153CD|nr:hypothetical protein [Bryobacter aggregatus]
MKWWSLLGAKLAFLAAIHLLLIAWINWRIPDGVIGIHLGYSFAVLAADMSVFVLGYFLWLDQKYRCRNCASRLRMPVAIGNWSGATIFSPPKMEWICPFGHGTMRHHEAPLSRNEPDQWQRNEGDFWKEFEDAWRKS